MSSDRTVGIPRAVGLLLAFSASGCAEDKHPIVDNWKLDLREGVGYPAERESGGCTTLYGARLDIDDESSGTRIYYRVHSDCDDPADNGREEDEEGFGIHTGEEENLYGFIFYDNETAMCTLEGDELHCTMPLSLFDIYVRG